MLTCTNDICSRSREMIRYFVNYDDKITFGDLPNCINDKFCKLCTKNIWHTFVKRS